MVAGGAFPRFARNPGTGESPATATTFLAARIDIYDDTEHSSWLTLPHTAITDAASGGVGLELDETVA